MDCSYVASEQYAKYSVAASVGTLSTRSAPPTSTTSEMPLATSITACRNAAWLVAQAVSRRVVGIDGNPNAVAASGAMWSCRSVSPPVTLPKESDSTRDGAMSASTIASAAASANSSALLRSCLPNLVIPTPITATRRIDPPGQGCGWFDAHSTAGGLVSKEAPAPGPWYGGARAAHPVPWLREEGT